MHKTIRSWCAVLRSLLVDWFHSPRTIISIIILVALAYMNARSYSFMLENTQLYAYPLESAYYFLSSGFGNIVLTSALFLIMMAEVPRNISFQNCVLIRSNRRSWLFSQIMFCSFTSIFTILALLLLSMLFSSAEISAGSGWSDLERIAANADAQWEIQLTDEFIRQWSPLCATLVSLAVLFFFWFTMTLVILLFSLCGKPNIGVMIYISLLVLHVTLLWESLPSWMRFMPVNFSTIQYIGSTFPENEIPAILSSIAVYILVDMALIVILNIRVKRMELFFKERS